ncbi:MAG: fibronectin type III domain-containing protein, partial [Allomuricauda sp.]
MKTNLYILLAFLTYGIGTAQTNSPEFLIQPYLQDAEPNSITIMWETNQGEESIVEWGKTPKVGKKARGTSEDINFSQARVHTVKLTGLDRFTMYYYRVKTGNLRSDIFQFKTPPFPSDNESFNIVAMSDMQYDHNYPNKFREMVNDGVLSYIQKTFGENVPDNLAMVLVPGDLVENGSKYHQWKDHFFNPAENLFREVPVYPVLGNHERNSGFYFKYFSLPKNGTPAYAEHWWYKDYGNTRIIGLNSNQGYEDLKEQREWLQKVLD